MQHAIVSPNEWLAARKALLAKEKDFTRARDQLSEARRALPWVKVAKQYVFDGSDGRETLAELFDGRSQLIVYHFMFGPGLGRKAASGVPFSAMASRQRAAASECTRCVAGGGVARTACRTGGV